MKESSGQLVSVVTVCFNAADVIECTLQSVLNQTYQDIEYIIVDGASTDGTVELVRRYIPKFEERGVRVTMISEPDGGIYFAMNKGVKMAKGKWLNFMNAGDTFRSADTIEKVFAACIPNDAAVVYGSTVQMFDFGEIEMKPREVDYLQKKMAFCHQSAFISTDDMKEHPYDTKYRLAADFGYFYDLYRRGGDFVKVDVPVAVFESENGTAHNNRLKVNKEYAQIKGLDGKLSWKVKFAFKTLSVKMKDAFYSVLPESAVQTIRNRNYKRLQRRRQKQTNEDL